MSGNVANDPTRSDVWDPSTGPRVLVFWSSGSVVRQIEPGEVLVLGRGDECDIQVLHTSVSRKHVEVCAGPPLTVRDLGSSNGTRLDGRPVGTSTPTALRYGDVVEFGRAIMIVQPGVGEAPTLVPPASFASDGNGAMERVRQMVKLVAPTRMPVLILGETGVGKEVTATQIHALSPRAQGPMVRVNCAAFSEALLESELFGHERGAFTGAHASKAGLLEAAHGGTLLLDEVGELSLALQAKLLRVLEDGEVRRIGATQSRAIDVRFVAATNRDLPACLRAATFRSDLYFRLNGVTLRVPPLRDRLDEIPALAANILAAAYARSGVTSSPLSADVQARLASYAWPGNVRELRNVLERAALLAGSAPITPEHLVFEASESVDEASATPVVDPPRPEPASADVNLRAELERIERQRIEKALADAHGNQTVAARLLGITRRQLIGRIEAYDLPRPRKKARES